MKIDIHQEHILSLTEASHTYPIIDGRKPHVSSLWRWARKGLRGVKLEYARIGHRIVTSQEALNRFANALAAADVLPPEIKQAYESPTNELSATRRAEIRRADEILTRDGILQPKN